MAFHGANEDENDLMLGFSVKLVLLSVAASVLRSLSISVCFRSLPEDMCPLPKCPSTELDLVYHFTQPSALLRNEPRLDVSSTPSPRYIGGMASP